jgi:uncharacterized protein
MIVALDTNVWIAAFISRGVCDQLVEYLVAHHQIVTSPNILDEFAEKMTGKFSMSQHDVNDALELISNHSLVVVPGPLSKPISRDPDDDWILATAVVGGCHCLITGDKDLLTLETYEGIPIFRPAAFWAFEANNPNR